MHFQINPNSLGQFVIALFHGVYCDENFKGREADQIKGIGMEVANFFSKNVNQPPILGAGSKVIVKRFGRKPREGFFQNYNSGKAAVLYPKESETFTVRLEKLSNLTIREEIVIKYAGVN